jgi:hypothetical protein
MNNPHIKNVSISSNTWNILPDIEIHYQYILNETLSFRNLPMHKTLDGYNGPWIENLWIKEFINIPFSNFSGLVPLFVQWTDIHALSFMGNQRKRFADLRQVLHKKMMSILRDDVIYVTVSQDDEGLSNKQRTGLFHFKPNILVFSAGGFGHIPIPLIKGTLDYVPIRYSELKHTVGFNGNKREKTSREALLNEIVAKFKKNGVSYSDNKIVGRNGQVDWKGHIAQSPYNLAPRGFGRTSYRLSEIIQIGRIPIYLYDDTPWIPYQGSDVSIERFGYIATFGQSIDEVVEGIKYSNESDLMSRVTYVKDVREYYTYLGVLNQIRLFLMTPNGSEGASKLKCTRVPENTI